MDASNNAMRKKAITKDGMSHNFTSLAAMNDHNVSFPEIAQVIREHADVIFEESR